MSFVALRSLPLDEFGAVAVAVLLFGLSLAATRALAGEPLLIRYTSAGPSALKDGLRKSLGASFLLGIGFGLTIAAAVQLADREIALTSLVLAALLPPLLVQDVYRYGLFASGRPGRALWLDLLWLVSLLAVLGIVAAGPGLSAQNILLSWATTGLLSAMLGAVLTRTLPRPFPALGWMRQQSDLSIPMFGEQVVGMASRQLVLFLIAGYVGLESLGALQGARTLFGPMNVLFLGSTAFAIPEVARLRTTAPSRVRGFIASVAALLLALSIALGGVLLLAPDSWVELLIGSSWSGVEAFILPTAIATGAMAVITTMRSGFRGLEMPVRSLLNSLTLAGMRLVFGTTSTFALGAIGGAYGLAGANLLGGFLFSQSFAKRTRKL